MTPAQQVAAAITWLTVSTEKKPALAPYLAHVLQLLVRVESQAVDTLAVSQRGVLYYNPEYVQGQGAKSLAWGLFHEGLHVALDHFTRAQAIGASVKPGDPVSPVIAARAKIANLAQDACINEILRETAKHFSVTLPAEWVYPETLQQPLGLAFEDRYQRLMQQAQQQPQGGGGGEGEGEGQGKGGGQGQGNGKNGVGNGACGSCCGNPTQGEKADEGVGRSDVDMARARRQMAEAVRKIAEKGRGTIPGALVRWAEVELAPPKVDWRTHVSESVRHAVAYRPGAVDHHYTRPSRRQAGLGFGVGVPVIAAFRAPVPEVGILMDVSGSMDDKTLSAGASEIEGILKAVGANVTVLAIDARVQGVAKVHTIQEAVALFRGGGGTDLREGFAELMKIRPAIEVIIAITDGHLGDGFPEVEPCKTIWCVIGSGPAAPWGTRIKIE